MKIAPAHPLPGTDSPRGEVLQINKPAETAAWVGMAAVALMALGSLVAIATVMPEVADPERLVRQRLAFLAIAGLIVSCAGGVIGLTYWEMRARRWIGIILTDRSLVLQDETESIAIDYDEIELDWTAAGSTPWIVLKTAEQRLRIAPSLIDPPSRLKLIRTLHRRVNESAQRNWPRFCHRTALPLIRTVHPTARRPPAVQPGDLLLTRRRWDVMFGGAIVATFAIVAISWQLTGRTEFVERGPVIILFWLGLWAFLRLSHPKQGLHIRQRNIAPGQSSRDVIRMGLLFAALLVSGIPLMPAFGLDRSQPWLVNLSLAAICMLAAMFFWRVQVSSRAMNAWQQQRYNRSAAAWERRERVVANRERREKQNVSAGQ